MPAQFVSLEKVCSSTLVYLHLGGRVFVVLHSGEAGREAWHSLQASVGEGVDDPEFVVQPVVVPAPGLATGLVELVKRTMLREGAWSLGLSRRIRRSS